MRRFDSAEDYELRKRTEKNLRSSINEPEKLNDLFYLSAAADDNKRQLSYELSVASLAEVVAAYREKKLKFSAEDLVYFFRRCL